MEQMLLLRKIGHISRGRRAAASRDSGKVDGGELLKKEKNIVFRKVTFRVVFGNFSPNW